MRILLADDDMNVLEPLEIALRREGYDVLVASDGKRAWELFRAERPDFAVLDINMPGLDGLSLTRRIGEAGEPRIPIILLTGRNQLHDKVKGLDNGADDYVVKPCSDRELLARIRAVWRRSSVPMKTVAAGDLVLNLDTHDFLVRGKRISVTSNEFILLQTLIERAGEVVRYKTLMLRIWGCEVSHDLLRVTVFRMRKKIHADTGNPTYIVTVPSVGYIVHAAHESELDSEPAVPADAALA